MRIEATDSLAKFGQGKGGYWEDVADYAWYAGYKAATLHAGV